MKITGAQLTVLKDYTCHLQQNSDLQKKNELLRSLNGLTVFHLSFTEEWPRYYIQDHKSLFSKFSKLQITYKITMRNV